MAVAVAGGRGEGPRGWEGAARCEGGLVVVSRCVRRLLKNGLRECALLVFHPADRRSSSAPSNRQAPPSCIGPPAPCLFGTALAWCDSLQIVHPGARGLQNAHRPRHQAPKRATLTEDGLQRSSNDPTIQRSINQSIHQSINQSIHQSFLWFVLFRNDLEHPRGVQNGRKRKEKEREGEQRKRKETDHCSEGEKERNDAGGSLLKGFNEGLRARVEETEIGYFGGKRLE